jgi:hypothetical protein
MFINFFYLQEKLINHYIIPILLLLLHTTFTT